MRRENANAPTAPSTSPMPTSRSPWRRIMPRYLGAGGAQRHPDPDLLGALADREGHQAGQARGGDHQRQPGEDPAAGSR